MLAHAGELHRLFEQNDATIRTRSPIGLKDLTLSVGSALQLLPLFAARDHRTQFLDTKYGIPQCRLVVNSS
jgi:hypothetical protein